MNEVRMSKQNIASMNVLDKCKQIMKRILEYCIDQLAGWRRMRNRRGEVPGGVADPGIWGRGRTAEVISTAMRT